MTKIFSFLLPFFIILHLPACSIYPVNLKLQGNALLNLDDHYHSLPVMISLYQLTDDNQFINASFHELWKQPKNALGDTILKHQSIILNPGEEKILNIHLKKGTNFICAIAIFRKPNLQHWKTCRRLPKTIPYLPKKIVFSLMKNNIYTQ